MKVPCSKCDQLFERTGKWCMICDDCWIASRKKGQRKPFHALKTCPICCEHIKVGDERIDIQKRLSTEKKYSHGYKVKSLGLYHASCWDKYILTKIEKLLTTDKVKAWQNRLKPLEAV